MTDAPRPSPARKPAPVRLRDAERSRRAILEAALVEFSEAGHAGARIDAIALRAGVSKPLIYSYFGDKDALYAAALREAYVQIREGERDLDLEHKTPEDAIRALVAFTLQHYVEKPWFISMLNTENLRGGTTIRAIEDVGEIQSPLVTQLGATLERGVAAGVFRPGIDPVDLYIMIASLCYFPVSNAHTLRVVFRCAIDGPWLARRCADAQEMVLRFLHPPAPGGGHA
ncbi:TetR family transcriptional regulator [Oceanicella sp. SM1341]|uniref:TetR family transcriptional regulator n=1 Tax=Oceanicella sp. SM1341 TaxID=1548889 RepID=UPI000E46C739|nr:TetR family transcriptional regulator [Oceanicella sp. SM1341]